MRVWGHIPVRVLTMTLYVCNVTYHSGRRSIRLHTFRRRQKVDVLIISGPRCVRDHQHQCRRHCRALYEAVGLVARGHYQSEPESNLRKADPDLLYVLYLCKFPLYPLLHHLVPKYMPRAANCTVDTDTDIAFIEACRTCLC